MQSKVDRHESETIWKRIPVAQEVFQKSGWEISYIQLNQKIFWKSNNGISFCYWSNSYTFWYTPIQKDGLLNHFQIQAHSASILLIRYDVWPIFL